jgi:SAM-dependent methyltransferase
MTTFYDDYYVNAGPGSPTWEYRELGGAAKARNIARIVPPVERVLDIGVGTGAVLAHLDRLGVGAAYTAVDISHSAIDLIRTRADISRLVEARTYDGARLPFAAATFDLAILSHVIEHLADPAPLIREACRVSRLVAIEVPLEDNLHIHIKTGLLRSRYRERIGHIQWFNPASFAALLQACGCVVIDQQIAYVEPAAIRYGKSGLARLAANARIGVRATLGAVAPGLYLKLATEHCIALVSGGRA